MSFVVYNGCPYNGQAQVQWAEGTTVMHSNIDTSTE